MRQTKVNPGNGRAAKIRTQAIIVCADPEIQEFLISVLSEFGIKPVVSARLDEATPLLAQEETVMAFSQSQFSEGSFVDVLKLADRRESKLPVIVCSEFYDKDLYIEAMGLGAFDYLASPYRRREVAWVVNNALSSGALPQHGNA